MSAYRHSPETQTMMWGRPEGRWGLGGWGQGEGKWGTSVIASMIKKLYI